MVWYDLEWFVMDCYGLLWFGKVLVLEYSRMFWETPKSFMVVGGGGTLQL